MFDLRENINNSSDEEDSLDNPIISENNSVIIAASYSTDEAVQKSLEQAAKTFAKPETYTGSRAVYDSQAAKKAAKDNLFRDNNNVTDPYTGNVLCSTRQEAERLFGDDWAAHLAESDHTVSLKEIFEETKDNVWNTVDDVKTAANSSANINVTSRKFNNAKRSRSNEEYVNDTDYLAAKGVKLTEAGKKQAIKDADMAQKSIDRQLNTAAVKNVVKTGNEAGMAGALNAGTTALTMTGIMNIAAVIKGEKSSSEAIADTVKDSGAAALTGYVVSDGLTIVSRSLSNSSSKFIQGLLKANVPGKVITAVMAAGNTLKKFSEGGMTTKECLLELGDTALNMAAIGYSMSLGQILIPIPGVGAAVGALVGSTLTSELYSELTGKLKEKDLRHQQRMQVIQQCNLAQEQLQAFNHDLEIYLKGHNDELDECVEYSLSSLSLSYKAWEVDGIFASVNDIIREFGGDVRYSNMEEFYETWDTDDEF